MADKVAADIREQIERGIAILKRGGLVAFPTDTVYGLGACYNDIEAVKKVFELKNRLESKALPIILADFSRIEEVVKYIPPVARLLADRFMPGALTLVMQKSDAVPDIITGGSKTVAVRVSPHSVPLALVKGIGVPIVGTSVNISGQPSSITGDEVRSQFGNKIDLVIDGRCLGGTESTIIDVTGDKPKILREGALSRKEIEKVCEVM